jgi:NTP pyrophosphatase (non-canonical NTP hydrolase)
MDMLAIQKAIGEWSDEQFGKDESRFFGMYNHLVQEMGELRMEVASLEMQGGAEKMLRKDRGVYAAGEIADCIMLLLDMANKLGVDMEKAVLTKLETNKQRTWTLSSDGVPTHTPNKQREPLCRFCHKPCESRYHIVQGRPVCEDCWDERLRTVQ